jgi:hypothetical protein
VGRRLVFIVLILAILGAIAFLALRPASVTGVHPSELIKSVRSAAGAMDFGGSCRHLRADDWRCTVVRERGNGLVTYRLQETSLGCWEARRTAGTGPSDVSGCITILDYL